MKKIIFCAALLGALQGHACDICGGNVSNYNPYLFPHLSKNYIGISALCRIYHTHAEDGSVNREHYAALLLTGQWSPLQRLQLSAMMPFQFNRVMTGASRSSASGTGDATLFARYRFGERLQIGGGVKFATGQYRVAETGGITDRNFQLGSGSTDYLLNASYRYVRGAWAFSAVTSYKYNTANSEGFRFGDVLTSGLTALRRIERSRLSLLPYVQIMHEHQMRDADQHVLLTRSGGDVLHAGGGLDVSSRRVSCGINYQFAVAQNSAGGAIDVKPRTSAHIFLNL